MTGTKRKMRQKQMETIIYNHLQSFTITIYTNIYNHIQSYTINHVVYIPTHSDSISYNIKPV